jgi:SAM-dependent methyltransferase
MIRTRATLVSMDATSSPPAVDQHNAEIHENLHHWRRKPELRDAYHQFYQLIAAQLTDVPEGPILECGSGIGNLKSVFPNAITSDLFPNPWLDRQENVYALSYPDRSLSAVVLFDVFHHLEFPGTALQEIRRTLIPGGRIVIFEPAMGWLGRLMLGLFHHEPLGLRRPITWSAPNGITAADSRYYAAQGNAWRIFMPRRCASELDGLRLKQVTPFPALHWILTGGFRGPSFSFALLKPFTSLLERMLQPYPKISASRMLITLERPL